MIDGREHRDVILIRNMVIYLFFVMSFLIDFVLENFFIRRKDCGRYVDCCADVEKVLSSKLTLSGHNLIRI